MRSQELFQTPVPPDYLRDESRSSGRAAGIAFATSADQVCEALRQAAARELPVTVQGARTGIAGGAVPDGGLIINLGRMDATCEPRDKKAATQRVQPGLALSTLRHHLTAEAPGRRFTPDPTETSATIGGMAACNASGARSFAHGAIRRHIHSMQIALADGDTLSLTRGQARAEGYGLKLQTDGGQLIQGELPRVRMPAVKNAAGYFCAPDMDLLDLFIGSEGTLGIITELELRLVQRPDAILGVLCFFKEEAGALACVDQLRATRHAAHPNILAAIEYFDRGALRLIHLNAASTGLRLPCIPPDWSAALYLEWERDLRGPPPEPFTEKTLRANGGDPSATWLAADSQTLEKLRLFRHAVPEQANATIAQRKKEYPELTKLGTDLAVPSDRLGDIMRLYRESLAAANLEYAIFGHIGDSHVHVNILPRDMAEHRAGRQLCHAWARQAVAWGGSISAEHGVGRLKRELLRLLYNDEELAAMRRLKRLFDPEWRLNPGKIL